MELTLRGVVSENFYLYGKSVLYAFGVLFNFEDFLGPLVIVSALSPIGLKVRVVAE